MERTLRIPLLILGVLFAVSGIAYAIFARLDAGFAVTVILGIIFLASGIFWRTFLRLSIILRVIYYGLIALLIGIIFFIGIFGAQSTVTGTEEAVIVLGVRMVNGKMPQELISRLERAIEYNKDNHAIILLSGGQGESAAMKEYLLSRGLPEDIIITEESSANTSQNIKNCKQMLSERTSGAVAVITSKYHVLRSSLIAENACLEANFDGAGTPLYLILPSIIRECIGIVRFLLIGY